jgi:peptidoglycan/LPS O-acetylase OafA/YrhL
MKQIKCLTSLRFFAAAMIVVFHSVNAFRIWDNRKIPFALEQGVSFFFVLSGFILTYVYPSLKGGSRIRDFYVARIARIWPAHFVAFLLLLWLIPAGAWMWNGHAWQILAANLFLAQAWIPSASYYFSFNGVSWSISTEVFFYVAFPFLICRLDCTWWWKLLCTTALVAGLLCSACVLRLPSYDPTSLFTVTAHGLVYINPLVRILEFVFGMAVASLCLRWREAKIVTSSPAWLWTVFELAVLGGMLSRVLETGWLLLLGEISYSIYLVHQIIIRWYLLNRSMFGSVPKTMLYIAYWLAVLSVSFIIWRVVEKPFQRWIRGRFGSKRDGILMAVTAPTIINS